jgi:hypothetical protein
MVEEKAHVAIGIIAPTAATTSLPRCDATPATPRLPPLLGITGP